jgi:hypothetical protein
LREPAHMPRSGGVAVATEHLRLTKQQEFDNYLNYDVTIARWRFELVRLGAWFIGFQISFFLLLIVPLVVLRTLTGADSPYIP